jgi:hypothetical protein
MIFIIMTERYLLEFNDHELSKQKLVSAKPISKISTVSIPLVNIREVDEDEEEISNKLHKPTAEEYSLFESTINIIQSNVHKPPLEYR